DFHDRDRMAAGFQHDDIAWFQFHDLPSAHDDADGTLAAGDDSQITAGAGFDGIDVENGYLCLAGTSSVSERTMRSGLMVDPGG
ncbi:hypothetical protein ACPXA1_25050, partial [Escherichia coli]|uniref:hypothetical protein n=1 Tax=Escherichia coli TaxID=562 RepID=UPI003CE91C32